MKLTMLGTGNAAVTECYNTCFVLEQDGRYFMVDGGGGNAILGQLRRAGYNWADMREIFVTHKHIDHLLGIVWMMRMICQGMSRGTYQGEAAIYGHDEVVALLAQLAQSLLAAKEAAFVGKRLHLIAVQDGEQRQIAGQEVAFFDIHSTKARQFGFCMQFGGQKRLVCCGDEPYNPCAGRYAKGCDWLLHEAFCLHAQADIFKPYQKHHSTVKDACTLASELGVRNLVLYHTEDKNIQNRKTLYTSEGRQYFAGAIYVPNDLESILLD